MEKAREAIQKKIKERGQLLFVIDELDRCNPHFCINLLETVKHFFDINGVFVILSFNRRTILQALSSIYGIDFLKDTKGENYLTKFIDERREIYGIDSELYLRVIREYFQKNKIRNSLLRSVASVFSEMRLSLREAKICAMRVADIISKTGNENNIELYSYISCRYDRNFEKIENKSPYDQSDENEIYVKRSDFFSRISYIVRRHCNLYPLDISEKDVETLKNITGNITFGVI